MNQNLTKHFTVSEASTTLTELPNQVPPQFQAAVLNTATNMELVRAILGRKPITINSWYRSPEVNRKVGGSLTSEHSIGQAVDFVCPAYGTPFEICKTLAMYPHILNYNQLIYEQTWVHISFPSDGTVGKKQLLTYKNGVYSQGLIK